MLTTDTLLFELASKYANFEIAGVSSQDKKILNSLLNQLKKQHFFTEKQGNLLVKIYWKYLECVPELNEDFKHLVEKPIWSQKFRVINTIRKIYFENDNKTNLIVEFTYDKSIKDKLNSLNFNNDNVSRSLSATKHKVKCTENNLVQLIEKLKNFNFEINQEIQELYRTVKLAIDNNENYLDLMKDHNKDLYKKVLQDIDSEIDNELLLLDRRHRFQYSYNALKNSENLDFKIANRKSTQVYVNSDSYDLSEVFSSLQSLKRFPALLIFNKNEVNESIEILKKIVLIEKELNLNNIGIYFRQDNNSDLNKEFNRLIQEFKFNSELTSSTEISGTVSTFLPKFFYKTKWYPKSVISFTNNFKSNKVFTYCDAVDCIIYYNNNKPLAGKMDEIL